MNSTPDPFKGKTLEKHIAKEIIRNPNQLMMNKISLQQMINIWGRF